MPCHQCHAPWARVIHTWTDDYDFTGNIDLTAYADYHPDSDIYPKKTALWRIVHDGSSQVVSVGVVRNDTMVRQGYPNQIQVDVNLGQGNPGVTVGFLDIDDQNNENFWYFRGDGNTTHTYRLEIGTARCENCWDVSWPNVGTRPYQSDELRRVYFEGDTNTLNSVSKCPSEFVWWRPAASVFAMGNVYDGRYETGNGTLNKRTTTRYPWHPASSAVDSFSESFAAASLAQAEACIVSRSSIHATVGVDVTALKAWLDTGNKVLVLDSMTDSAIWSTLGISTSTAEFVPNTDFPASDQPGSHFTVGANGYHSTLQVPGTYAYTLAGPSGALDGVTISWGGNTTASGVASISHAKLAPSGGSTTLAEVTFSQQVTGGTDMFGPFPGLVLEQVGTSLVVVTALQDSSPTSQGSPTIRVGSAVAVPDQMLLNLIEMAQAL